MQQTNTEGPALGPARAHFEVGKDEFSITSAILGKDQNGDDNSQQTSKSPKDGSSLFTNFPSQQNRTKSTNEQSTFSCHMNREGKGRMTVRRKGFKGVSHQAKEATCCTGPKRHCTGESGPKRPGRPGRARQQRHRRRAHSQTR